MHWRTKAFVQRTVSYFPEFLRESVYYRIQRATGAFRFPLQPWEHFVGAKRIADAARRHGISIVDAEILEIGTGHRLLVPIALWLLGAKRITTLDVHRYLKMELIAQDIEQLRMGQERTRSMLAIENDRIHCDRLEQLAQWSRDCSLDALLRNLNIEYLAPGGTRRLKGMTQRYDLCVSRSVFEHVSPKQLETLLRESDFVMRAGGGVQVHLVDFSDHFSHGDASVSSINFLRFSEREWLRIAGNQFAYHNRLRSEDFEDLFRESGFTVVESDLSLDERAMRDLEAGFPVHSDFRKRINERLAHREGLFVIRKLA